MSITMKSILILMLVFTMCEVFCDVVTVTEDQNQDNTSAKDIFRTVYISHGKEIKTTKKLDFDSSDFICLDKDHNIEISTQLVPSSFKIILNVSYDFGPYSVHNSTKEITFFDGKEKACFFYGYFVRDLLEKKDKGELFINFITDGESFDRNRLLILTACLDDKYVSPSVYAVVDEVRKNRESDSSLNDKYFLAKSQTLRNTGIEITNFKVNGQLITLDKKGNFEMTFTDPKYITKTLPTDPIQIKNSYKGGNNQNPGMPYFKEENKEIIIDFWPSKNTESIPNILI